MKSIDILSTSSNQTMNIAKILAKHLSKGDTVVLTGELGSGKTKFTEGFLSYYGLEEEISNLEKILLEYEDKNGEIYSHIEKDELQKFIDRTMEKARINRKNFEDDFCYLYKHLENPKEPLEILYKSLYVLSLKDDSNKNK